MSTLIRERSRSNHSRRPRRRGDYPAARRAAGQPTLEDTVLAAFDGLVSAGSAPCPVCSAERLTPSGCSSCGSRLS